VDELSADVFSAPASDALPRQNAKARRSTERRMRTRP
jgi:hypothetical protein